MLRVVLFATIVLFARLEAAIFLVSFWRSLTDILAHRAFDALLIASRRACSSLTGLRYLAMLLYMAHLASYSSLDKLDQEAFTAAPILAWCSALAFWLRSANPESTDLEILRLISARLFGVSISSLFLAISLSLRDLSARVLGDIVAHCRRAIARSLSLVFFVATYPAVPSPPAVRLTNGPSSWPLPISSISRISSAKASLSSSPARLITTIGSSPVLRMFLIFLILCVFVPSAPGQR